MTEAECTRRASTYLAQALLSVVKCLQEIELSRHPQTGGGLGQALGQARPVTVNIELELQSAMSSINNALNHLSTGVQIES